MDYINPYSITFWAGAAMVLSGVGLAVISNIPGWEVSAAVLADITGNQPPFMQITTGFGLIGLRRAIGANA